MPASFDGNDGNDGNSANAGGGGNATSVSAGWFFADRVNLPFVTARDRKPGSSNDEYHDRAAGHAIKIKNFPEWNWSDRVVCMARPERFHQRPAWNSINPKTNALTSADWPTWIPGPPAPSAIIDPLSWIGRNPPCCRMRRRRSTIS